MSKSKTFQKTNFKPRYTERELPPRVATEKDGSMVLLCPNCNPPHPVQVNVPSPCGTLLKVTTIQKIYKSKFFPDMKCMKCGEGGGDMIQFNAAFLHLTDCKPGTVVVNAPLPMSKSAKFAFNLKPGRLKDWFTKKYGVPTPVSEVNPEGKKTGETLGYVFNKRSQDGPATQ